MGTLAPKNVHPWYQTIGTPGDLLPYNRWRYSVRGKGSSPTSDQQLVKKITIVFVSGIMKPFTELLQGALVLHDCEGMSEVSAALFFVILGLDLCIDLSSA